MTLPRTLLPNALLKSTTLGLLCLTTKLFSSLALAESFEEVSAVQNRIYDRKHEISLRGGVMPNAQFFVNYPAAGAYTYHLNEWLGWEVIRGTYYANKTRAITQTLIDEYEVEPSEFDYPEYSAQSSLILKPTYGKDSWFNKRVIHHQTYLTLGGGLMGFKKEYRYGEPTTELAWTARVGMGRKYFISQNLALSFEIENHMAFKTEKNEQFLQMNAGLDFRFNLTSPASSNASLESLYEFLERR